MFKAIQLLERLGVRAGVGWQHSERGGATVMTEVLSGVGRFYLGKERENVGEG